MTKKICTYVSLFIVVLTAIIFFQYRSGTSYLDSDMSSLMVYANQLNEEHSMISNNWYYSTEILLFEETHLYKITIALFPDNWHAARVLAKGIALLVLGVVFVYMCYGAKLGCESILGGIVLISPFGTWQTYHNVFDPSYTTSMIYLSLIYGGILHVARKSKYKPIHYFILIVTSVISGLIGPRLLLVAIAPILVASFLTYGLKMREQKAIILKDFFELRLIAASVFSTILVLFGYIINSKYLCKRFSFADSSQTWKTFSIQDIFKSISDFLSNFGFAGQFYGDMNVMSIRGMVTGGLGIMLVVGIIFMFIRLFVRMMKLDSPNRFIALSGFATIMVCSTLFGLMDGLGGGNGGYYITIIPVIVAVAIVEISTEDYAIKYSKRAVVCIVMISILMLSVIHSKLFIEKGYRHPDGIEEIVKCIEENGAYKGYASFWNGPIMTEISNGKIEVWSVEDLVTSGLQVKPWFQKKDHLTQRPDGKVFIAGLTHDECANMLSVSGMEDKLVYQDGDSRMLFIFENVEELESLIPLAQ